MSTDPNVVLAYLGNRRYTTLGIEAASLPACLRALIEYLESPDGKHMLFDSLTVNTCNDRVTVVADLNSRDYRFD